ncbi:hypothetical protein [Halobacillus sp. A5]|uniref:hypothetical protein n=1 Tax=Halobacillus sp. A5 TaxID=2880263 RepID=UPI0020A65869|nr:hypothetical protein [Halobacillus sp. A5]MCP3027436.1 hypothetical protein [Halobacillus sp. A5]
MNSFNIYLSLLSVVLLTACSFMIADANDSGEAASDKQEPYKITRETETKDIKEYLFSIEYPQTRNDQIDQSIIDYVNQAKDAFKKESYDAKLKNSHQKHTLDVTYDILHEDERVFVVKFTEKMDMGNQPEQEKYTVLNFDKSNGKRLDLDHIFTEDKEYLDTLNELADDRVEGNFNLMSDDRFRNLAVIGDRVEVYLTEREKKDVEADSKKIQIPKAELKDLMRPRYAEIHNSWID